MRNESNLKLSKRTLEYLVAFYLVQRAVCAIPQDDVQEDATKTSISIVNTILEVAEEERANV